MTISKLTLVCLLGLGFAACTAEEGKQADPTPDKKSAPAESAANLTTVKLELDKVP